MIDLRLCLHLNFHGGLVEFRVGMVDPNIYIYNVCMYCYGPFSESGPILFLFLQMAVASSIATTKIEKLFLSWKSAAEGNRAAGSSKRLKLRLNRKYNSLYPVLEVEEEST